MDHLSNGRLILGVGLGGLPHEEFEVFGEPSDPKVHGEMLDEALTIMTGLWTGNHLVSAEITTK